jgi:hypothetical protein
MNATLTRLESARSHLIRAIWPQRPNWICSGGRTGGFRYSLPPRGGRGVIAGRGGLTRPA